MTGQAEADLKGLLNKLADLGVSGTAAINTESYAGVLREDVRGTMQDSRECKLMIWNDVKATVAQQAVAPVLQSESAPHAPPIEINQRFQMWEEQTMQFVLEPGAARDLEGLDLYTEDATYPRSSCAGPGFVPYTWQICDPHPGGGDLEIRKILRGERQNRLVWGLWAERPWILRHPHVQEHRRTTGSRGSAPRISRRHQLMPTPEESVWSVPSSFAG